MVGLGGGSAFAVRQRCKTSSSIPNMQALRGKYLPKAGFGNKRDLRVNRLKKEFSPVVMVESNCSDLYQKSTAFS